MSLEHRQKIQNAIAYIRQHIREPLTAAQVAKAAAMSEFHFQRVFKHQMHETLGQYVTRKKLECAAVALLYGCASSVTDLAHDYGYASTASFSKAFAQWFGCRPTALASDPLGPSAALGRLQRSYEKALLQDELRTDPSAQGPEIPSFEELDSRVSIRNVEGFSVYCHTSDGGYQLDAVEEAWRSMRELLEDRGVDWGTLDRFAICHDHPGLLPKESCRYDACIKIEPHLPDDLPFFRAEIPAGRYAIFPCTGPAPQILPQYIAFYSIWLPQSPYVPDDFPVVDHCLTEEPEGYTMELWAKIRRA